MPLFPAYLLPFNRVYGSSKEHPYRRLRSSPHRLCLLNNSLNRCPEFRPLLDRHIMPPPLENPLRHTHLLTTQLLCQDLTMWYRDQVVRCAVYDQNPLSTNLVRNFLHLLGTFLMVPCSDSLTDKARSRETLTVSAFCEFLRCEAVAVCGEVAVLIKLGKP